MDKRQATHVLIFGFSFFMVIGLLTSLDGKNSGKSQKELSEKPQQEIKTLAEPVDSDVHEPVTKTEVIPNQEPEPVPEPDVLKINTDYSAPEPEPIVPAAPARNYDTGDLGGGGLNDLAQYSTCKEFNDAGLGNFNRDHPAYTSRRDRDKDGIACEF